MDGLLTIKQVAEYLNVSPRTVRRFVAGRRISCVRFGRSLRFLPADVFRFVEGRRE
jgi:excisionase family DNA binding protein